jgi:hypothetical protein
MFPRPCVLPLTDNNYWDAARHLRLLPRQAESRTELGLQVYLFSDARLRVWHSPRWRRASWTHTTFHSSSTAVTENSGAPGLAKHW